MTRARQDPREEVLLLLAQRLETGTGLAFPGLGDQLVPQIGGVDAVLGHFLVLVLRLVLADHQTQIDDGTAVLRGQAVHQVLPRPQV